jgi:hypothetical protein
MFLNVLFPLTPALSLRERENHLAALVPFKRFLLQPRRKTILPLPKGEGRGEGERDERLHIE